MPAVTPLVDADIPAGNIVVEGTDAEGSAIRPDLRDTAGDWFYWHFRVTGAGGRSLRFRLTRPNTLTNKGPAVSLDQGWTWQWLGAEACNGWSFAFSVPAGVDDVRFSVGMPYTERNLRAALRELRPCPHLEASQLCTTAKGRSVELIRAGNLGQAPAGHRVLVTVRHHCCEMMASYVLEGLLAAMLTDDDLGPWFREHAEVLAVPFVDKDGVEDGDQGKNRRPRDHNRDYEGRSAHRETEALRRFVPQWADGGLSAALDLHCPCLRGQTNEYIYFVGQASPAIWEEQCRFAEILESTCSGPLPYRAADNMPFGVGWNTAKNYGQGKHSIGWASEQTGIRLATGIEVPYALASGVEVNPGSARAFGRDLARALRTYL